MWCNDCTCDVSAGLRDVLGDCVRVLATTSWALSHPSVIVSWNLLISLQFLLMESRESITFCIFPSYFFFLSLKQGYLSTHLSRLRGTPLAPPSCHGPCHSVLSRIMFSWPSPSSHYHYLCCILPLFLFLSSFFRGGGWSAFVFPSGVFP